MTIAGHREAEHQTVNAGTMELTVYHWILIVVFIGIVVWAFGRKRKLRFEKDAEIPFDDR